MTSGNRGGDSAFIGAAWTKLRSPLPVPNVTDFPLEWKIFARRLDEDVDLFKQPFDKLRDRLLYTVVELVETWFW